MRYQFISSNEGVYPVEKMCKQRREKQQELIISIKEIDFQALKYETTVKKSQFHFT